MRVFEQFKSFTGGIVNGRVAYRGAKVEMEGSLCNSLQ